MVVQIEWPRFASSHCVACHWMLMAIIYVYVQIITSGVMCALVVACKILL